MIPAIKPDPVVETVPLKRNVVAVASGKGGVGKTWFSITLAHALARAGHRTLLFDGDLGLANIDVQLGVAPYRDLGAVIAGKATMAQVVERYEDGGFDVVAGRSGSGNLASLPTSCTPSRKATTTSSSISAPASSAPSASWSAAAAPASSSRPTSRPRSPTPMPSSR
jgi:hypothetical protein